MVAWAWARDVLSVQSIPLMSRFEEAEVLLLQAEKSVVHSLGHFHPALAALLPDLALVKRHTGDSQQAQQLLRYLL